MKIETDVATLAPDNIIITLVVADDHAGEDRTVKSFDTWEEAHAGAADYVAHANAQHRDKAQHWTHVFHGAWSCDARSQRLYLAVSQW